MKGKREIIKSKRILNKLFGVMLYCPHCGVDLRKNNIMYSTVYETLYLVVIDKETNELELKRRAWSKFIKDKNGFFCRKCYGDLNGRPSVINTLKIKNEN